MWVLVSLADTFYFFKYQNENIRQLNYFLKKRLKPTCVCNMNKAKKQRKNKDDHKTGVIGRHQPIYCDDEFVGIGASLNHWNSSDEDCRFNESMIDICCDDLIEEQEMSDESTDFCALSEIQPETMHLNERGYLRYHFQSYPNKRRVCCIAFLLRK